MPAKGQRSGVYVSCENCGKIVYKTQTEYNRREHHFCSLKCQGEMKSKEHHEERVCEFCGKTFSVIKSNPQRFCSIHCQVEWQRANTGEKNPKFEGTIVECDWCGKQFELCGYKLKQGGHHFCSNDCRRTWYSKIFSQSGEWKEESRVRAANILSDRKISTDTKPQRIVNDILENLGIEYINEENYVYYSVDNYLPAYNLIIEVMGDFWHCNPLVYPDGYIHEVQKNRIPKDKAKRTYLKHIYGIEVLYIWESDIYENIRLCEELILQYVNNDGILDNYNSFNYHLNENILKVNQTIVHPYFERNLCD